MEFTKLSNRLDLVASFVPAGARLLDVGSDHAYLPIALLQESKIEAAKKQSDLDKIEIAFSLPEAV